MYKVLILEDDALFGETLKEFLEDENFQATLATNAFDAKVRAYEENFDLFLFDVNLPGESGLSALKDIRGAKNNSPALFLTSRRDKQSLLRSFEIGGDDFLSKPVDFDELLARINAVLKRAGKSFCVDLGGGFTFDQAQRSLYKDGTFVDLGAMPSALLALLSANIGKLVTKEAIEDELYKSKPASCGAVRVYVNLLNNILGAKRVVNIRSVGYKLEAN
ncbi:MAG: response regulator transcription factor [Helicobacteraceae bacterium]